MGKLGSINKEIQFKLLNVITLVQTQSDNNNWIIIITDSHKYAQTKGYGKQKFYIGPICTIR